MPLYEYRCPACDERFEVLQRLGEGAEGLACPRCGGAGVEKQFSTFASGRSAGTGASPGPAAPSCGSGSGFR